MTAQQLEKLVKRIRENTSTEAPTVAAKRQQMRELGDKFTAPADARVQTVSAGGVPGEIVMAPGVDERRTILYLHGGGYVVGSPHSHRNFGYHLSKAADARVLNLDYRLAPEHPFPAAVDDAVAAWRWLLDGGQAPGRGAVAGDSAGGGLAAAMLVALRDAGGPMPGAGVCISPWTDMEGTGGTMTSKAAEDPMVTLDGLRWMADLYMNGGDYRHPLASPLHADLKGLPPLLIQVGSAEILLDDSRRLAERARAAGVDVTLREWQDMIHVWHLFSPMLSEGMDAIGEAGSFVRTRTG